MPVSIMVDAGHGGTDPGAVYNGRQEKDDNLRLALAVGEILQNKGVDVQYTRTTDIFLPLAERVAMANQAGVDYFVSIHRNSFPTDNEVSGVETLVYDRTGIKYEMAENIDGALENIGFVNLGVKTRPGLYVLRRTNMPALLVEAGFVNSDHDNRLFDENFDAVAQGIADGILRTLEGETDPEPEIPHPTTNYSVQVGLFRNPAYARRLMNELTAQDFPAYIDNYGQYDRVKVGDYADLDDAAKMEQQLKRAGYQTLVVSHLVGRT